MVEKKKKAKNCVQYSALAKNVNPGASLGFSVTAGGGCMEVYMDHNRTACTFSLKVCQSVLDEHQLFHNLLSCPLSTTCTNLNSQFLKVAVYMRMSLPKLQNKTVMDINSGRF